MSGDQNMSDSSSDEDYDENHPDAYKGNEEVQIDFEGRTASDPDCDGIAQLLSRLFLKAQISHLEMANLIISQNYVGSVVCQCETDLPEDEEEMEDDLCEEGTVFGVTTVLNITAKKDINCIKQLRSYILKKAEENAPHLVFKYFSDLITQDKSVIGFLINERFINIPAQISVPLFENLVEEMQAANKKGMAYNVEYFLMIIKFFRKEGRKGKPAEDIYTNSEEELISENAFNSFEFSVASECDMGMGGDWLEGDPTLTPYRKVVIFEANKLSELIKNIKTYVNQ